MATKNENNDDDAAAANDEAPARLRRAETILQSRTGRIAVVLEKITDSHNQSAVLRSIEAMGIQNVFIIEPTIPRNETCKPLSFAKKITKSCYKWLTVRSFNTTLECIQTLKNENYKIWATDLSNDSINIDENPFKHFKPFPEKVAIIIGRESDGVSNELLNIADKRLYIPMYGFTESYNLSVACALILQKLFEICPEARGNLLENEKNELRHLWFEQLTKTPAARFDFLSELVSFIYSFIIQFFFMFSSHYYYFHVYTNEYIYSTSRLTIFTLFFYLVFFFLSLSLSVYSGLSKKSLSCILKK